MGLDETFMVKQKRYKRAKILVNILSFFLSLPLLIMVVRLGHHLIDSSIPVRRIPSGIVFGLGYLAMAIIIVYRRWGLKRGYLTPQQATNDTEVEKEPALGITKMLFVLTLVIALASLFGYLFFKLLSGGK